MSNDGKSFLIMLIVAALACVIVGPVGAAIVALVYLLRKVSRMPTDNGNSNSNNSSNNS